MLKKLWVLPVDIRLSAHTNKLRFRPRSYSYVGEVPTLDVFEQPINDWDLVMKSLFDRIVGGIALLALSPLLALVALAIKLDSRGPVFFKQKRFGFNNERIDVFKFRSLYHEMADPTASKLVTKDDPRVTRVGRFIRKTSIDELPQLINVVFKGNLSLVGPRPHAVQQKLQNQLLDEAVDGYFARHRVRPGITGWAQINGWRGEVDSAEKIQRRVEFDLYYIENWSVLFDAYILSEDAARAAEDRKRVLTRRPYFCCRFSPQASARSRDVGHTNPRRDGVCSMPDCRCGIHRARTTKDVNSMLKNLRSIAGAAIILATLATTTVQAKQIETDTPKTERIAAQKLAKAQTQAPYFWLVLGVGY